MSRSEHHGEVLTATTIGTAFADLATQLGEAATLSFHASADGTETLMLQPSNPRSLAVCFDYDTGPDGAGEIRFDIAGADEPIDELEDMLELTQAAIDGQVVVKEDWLRRQVTITTRSGVIWNCRVTGLLGSLFHKPKWRPTARTITFEAYTATG